MNKDRLYGEQFKLFWPYFREWLRTRITIRITIRIRITKSCLRFEAVNAYKNCKSLRDKLDE